MSAFRAVGLGDNADYLEIRRGQQRLQAEGGQFGRAHENEAEGGHVAECSVFGFQYSVFSPWEGAARVQ